MRKIIGVFFFIVLMIADSCTGNIDSSHNGISHYEADLAEVSLADEYMPSLDSLGDYENISYGYRHFSELFFTSEAMSLAVTYSGEEYETQKAAAAEAYDYLEEPLKVVSEYDSSVTLLLPVTEIEYEEYKFRIAGKSCKHFIIVGYNDEAETIVYWYFSSYDLDYIATAEQDPEEEMRRFLEWYFFLPE